MKFLTRIALGLALLALIGGLSACVRTQPTPRNIVGPDHYHPPSVPHPTPHGPVAEENCPPGEQ